MWTALTLAVLFVVGSLAYAGWAIHAIGSGAPWWPFVVGYPVAWVMVPLLFTCVWMFLGWWLRGERPADVGLTMPQKLRMFGSEFLALAQSAPRMIFYRWTMPEPQPAPADLPLLLVHGVGCNAGVWAGMRRYLERKGLGPVYAISYGPPLASIEAFADQLATRIGEVRRATGAAHVILVCHSMGGLVARAYLRRYGSAAVAKLLTIGTPHRGSRLAWMMFGPALTQMRPSSPYLADLNGSIDGYGIPVVSLWSWHDSMVAPQTSSRLDGADNIVISGVAHNALLNDPGVWASVASEIRKVRSAVRAA